MKILISVLFYISFGFIPIGFIFRLQRFPGGNTFIAFGLLGLLIYFTAKTIRDLVKKRNDKLNIALQLLIVLMSITLFSKYLYHTFGDYPGLVIVPLFITASLFCLIKCELKYIKLTITSITFLLLTIPLFGFKFYKSPRHYIPKEWYNRFDVKGGVAIDLPYGFIFKEAEQLSVKAFSFKQSKKYSDAIVVYRKALKIEPYHPKLLFDMADCYALNNELATSIAILDTAIMHDNSYAPFYNNRGLAFYKLNKQDDAFNDYQKAIQLDPSQPTFYANIALVYYKKDDFENAREALKRAEQLGLDLDYAESLNELIR